MPRQKRPLSEADANATKLPTKRVSTGSTSAGNENEAASGPNYEAMTKSELSGLLKARCLPSSGVNKTALIARLREADVANPKIAAKLNATAVPDLEFVTMCRPWSDFDKEKRDKKKLDVRDVESGEPSGEKDDDDEEEIAENRCGDGTCMCKKPIRDHPEWKWVISTQGLDMVLHLKKDFWERDQDVNGQYHCNHWTGYGFQEVIENQLLAIDKDMAKNDARALWPHLEALAAFVPDNSDEWFMSDDADSIKDALKMIGGAAMGSLTQLEKEGLLHKDSSIPNIGLVVGTLKRMVEKWPGDLEDWQLSWTDAAIFKVKQAGVEFKGVPYGINEQADELEGETGDWDTGEVEWEGFNWTKELAAYKEKHRKGSTIGGSHYSLVKEKKKPRASSKKKTGGRRLPALTLRAGERYEDFL